MLLRYKKKLGLLVSLDALATGSTVRIGARGEIEPFGKVVVKDKKKSE